MTTYLWYWVVGVTFLSAVFTKIKGDDFRECPFPPPCICKTYKIYQAFCQGQNFSKIPKLYPSVYNGTWFVDFSDNMITNIPANAFQNISVNTLWVSNNNISNVDEEAFLGSEDIIESFYLNGNKLTTLPIVLRRLSALSELTVENNPIKYLDANVMMKLPKSLHQFSFGSSVMSSWPEPLKYLTNLKILSFFGLPMNFIPENAFTGFESTLLSLQIESTNISKIPLSINKLKNLYTIIINYNRNLKSLSEEIFKDLSNIHNFIVQDNAIENISAIFKDSSSMDEFALHSNTITVVSDSVYAAKYQPHFRKLSLLVTQLTSVPKAVSNIPSLTNIEMYGANISIIRSTDFLNLPSLVSLQLSSNPITTIEKDAFVTSPSLEELDLSYTKLITVPEAIKRFKPYSRIDLRGANVQCTCEDLAWMKTWINRNITYIDGECANLDIPIFEFQLKRIPKC